MPHGEWWKPRWHKNKRLGLLCVYFGFRYGEIILIGSKGSNALPKKEDIDKNKGWKYAFRSESDFECICTLIVSYLEDRPYELPQQPIRLRKRTKTRTAMILGEIHKDLSERQFSTDEEFLNIVRCIKDFEESPDLLKALKRWISIKRY